MQPRGQLWFALEGICKDFRNYSGIGEKESLEVLIVVLTNMLAEQKTALEKLNAAKVPEPDNSMRDDASYVCDSCGEEIVVPIDVSAGADQEYVEDCPVCCRPNVVHVEVDEDGEVRVWAAKE